MFMKAQKSSLRDCTVRSALAILLLAGAVSARAETGMNTAHADAGAGIGIDIGADGDRAVAGEARNLGGMRGGRDAGGDAFSADAVAISPYTNASTSVLADAGVNAGTAGASINPNPNISAGDNASTNTAAATGSNASAAGASVNHFGVQITGGVANHDVKKAEIGFVWDPGLEWWHIGGFHFTVVGEVHIAYWDVETTHHVNPDTWEFGVSPVFRIIKDSGWIRPYFEAGVGVRMLAHVQQEPDHTMSSSFQFADMVGVGAQFGKHQNYQAGFRFQHLSNAGLKHPNPGIDFSQIYLEYNF